ncbi:RloB family protein [Emticicia agri]|uniref:RloB domain-containing protein n=1 Tax=Emticicia agri TaxID=2492393 RepID=A0A4V1ZCN6_9BACT|nr:RloB family protein [Emticicia agri]RYU93290.1 RloB domain-containing protein [Emticicia agri]
MSLKPAKKGDQGKAWNRKTQISKYPIETRTKGKRFLIVCEGQTEEWYFKKFPVLTATIEAIGIGRVKMSLVEYAKRLAKQEDYDEVWCVFDMDINYEEKQKEDFNSAIHKIAYGRDRRFKVAYSNDSFELWFLLHYKNVEEQQLRGYFYDKLSELWEINYEKEGKKLEFCKNIYEKLDKDTRAEQEEAINRARRQFESVEHLSPHEQNPVTKVYLLVEELNKHLRP